MRILILLLFYLAISCSPSTKNPNVLPGMVSLKTYGGTKNESAQSITRTADGGYAVAGYTQSMDLDITDKNNESYDYWVLKFDVFDTLEWSKTFGGSEDDRSSSIIQTFDGGYAVLGYSKSNDGQLTENAGDKDFWLVKLSSDGNLIWQKTFGFSGADSGNSVIQTFDGGYILTGVLDVTASEGEGNSKLTTNHHAGGDYWIIKLDAQGNTEWRNYYGGTFSDTPYDVVETNNGDFILVGSSDSNDVDISDNKGDYDFWVVKINNIGEIIWETSLGGTQIDGARAIIEKSDGSYMIAGDTRSSDVNVNQNSGAADLWLVNISSGGTIISERSFGGSDFDVARSLTHSNGGYILSGSSRSSDLDLTENRGQNDGWILKLNPNSQIDWQTTVGGSGIDYLYAAIELQNGTVIAVGNTNSTDLVNTPNKGFEDLLIVKID